MEAPALSVDTSLRELREHPRVLAVLERHHLDDCCRGKRSLAEACYESKLDPTSVHPLDELALRQPPPAALANAILETHHRVTREAGMPR